MKKKGILSPRERDALLLEAAGARSFYLKKKGKPSDEDLARMAQDLTVVRALLAIDDYAIREGLTVTELDDEEDDS